MTLRPVPLSARGLPVDPPRAGSFGLIPRLLVLAGVFAAELLLLSLWLDNEVLVARGGAVALIGQGGAWAVRGLVGFSAVFLTFAYLKSRTALLEVSLAAEQSSVSTSLIAAHVLAMAVFAALSWALYGDHLALPANLCVLLWLVTGLIGIVTAATAFLPLPLWSRLLRLTGSLWAFAIVAAIAACTLGNYLRLLWEPTANLTFALVQKLLTAFLPVIISDPVTRTIGTPNFSVIIAPECSGFEGVGLIVAFAVCWLWLFRRECRFPQAFLLIPAGIVTIYLLNIVRITALILLGNAGAPQVALGGFHSQAGWIAFNAVALGFCLVAARIPWITRPIASFPDVSHAPAADAATSVNPTVTFLLPFVAILAVGMISTAASSNFEWLYPLRFLAAATVLWAMRNRYRSPDLRITWFGPLIGGLVFGLWIALDLWLRPAADDPMPHALASTSAPIRIFWIVFRVLAAVSTVPIAEELAFRGFLLRRIISEDFETLPLTTFTWFSLGVSSLAFGLLHGHLWLAGTLAGLLYAWAMLRRGRLGDAIIAHATTNALLAAYVLLFHKWHLW